MRERERERENGKAHSLKLQSHLATNNNTLTAHTAARTAVLLIKVGLILGAGVLGRLGDIAALAATAVELDAVALAGDSVALTVARRGIRHGADRRGRGTAGRAGRERRAHGRRRGRGQIAVVVGHAG